MLMVEDDDPDAYLIGRALERNPRVRGVVRAEDGVEALDLVRRGLIHPDLAIVDLHMPRKNGISLLADFAKIADRRLPSVILTSSKSYVNAWRAKHRGAIRFLTKSPSPEQLAIDLDRVIEVAF